MRPNPELPSVDAARISRLLARQRPEWVDLPLTALTTSGTEHHAWRLGDDLLLRLPRDDEAAAGLAKEAVWLPRLAGRLPLPVPTLRHLGEPEEGFPRHWAVTDWMPGADGCDVVLAERVPSTWAEALADLVLGLHGVDLTAVPPAAWPVGNRGGSLRPRVADVRDHPAVLASIPADERAKVDAALDEGLRLEPDPGPPVLLHADLIPGNLVHRDGELVALLDLGTLTTGNPAWDLTPAWWVLDPAGRAAFRECLEVDDATWAAGRALALTQGLLARWYYEHRGHALAPLGARAVAHALMED